MSETTQATPGQTIPTIYAWCTWHAAYSHGCRLVRIVEQGSNGGGGIFACTPCREKNGLVPVADVP